jgi:hypothetical protein
MIEWEIWVEIIYEESISFAFLLYLLTVSQLRSGKNSLKHKPEKKQTIKLIRERKIIYHDWCLLLFVFGRMKTFVFPFFLIVKRSVKCFVWLAKKKDILEK